VPGLAKQRCDTVPVPGGAAGARDQNESTHHIILPQPEARHIPRAAGAAARVP
jgi:hypothetical protein